MLAVGKDYFQVCSGLPFSKHQPNLEYTEQRTCQQGLHKIVHLCLTLSFFKHTENMRYGPCVKSNDFFPNFDGLCHLWECVDT